jgi:hypothetical protein
MNGGDADVMTLPEDLIQSRVERMRRTARQVFSRYPDRRLLRVLSSFAHRHRRQCSTRDRSCRFSNAAGELRI